LASQGIDHRRIFTKGYGGEKPLYPKAATSAEKSANRRVEIGFNLLNNTNIILESNMAL